MRAVWVMLAAMAVCVAAPLRAADRPRNIIVILADDLGWAELGCYGHTFNETPNLDRMAREGSRFTSAYAAAPVCSPTRAALMTGLLPARLGITDYLGPQEKEKYLRPEQPTINKLLSRGGYISGLIGKWHLTGDYALRRGEPAKHQWDEVICSETSYIGPGYYFPPYKHMPGEQVLPGREYLTDRLNHEAVAFIRRHSDRPFFLCLSHYAPHTQLVATERLAEKYRNKAGAGTPGKNSPTRNRNNPLLAAMLESIDEGVGMILATLAELKLDERTVVIFTSDNGGETRVTINGRLREGKSALYEGGVRVPLIVRSPGRFRAGQTIDVPVVTPDLFATLCAIGGVRPTPNDGVSILPLLTGEASTLPDRAFYWHYPLAKPHFLGGRSSGAIREGDWKLIEFFDNPAVELYNLRDDPGEQRDLAAAHRDIARQLKSKLTAWRQTLPESVR